MKSKKTAELEKVSIELLKPEFGIGQIVYTPRKNEVSANRITRYNIKVCKVFDHDPKKEDDLGFPLPVGDGRLVGILHSYELEMAVKIRAGCNSDVTFSVPGYFL